MGSFFNKTARKEDPTIYQNKDGHLKRTLRVRDFLALGIGTTVPAFIFTLPGIVAAEHAGPAVALSFLLAAIVVGPVASTYTGMVAAMLFAGSAYSWVNVLFGEFFGWVTGWALLTEYFIAVAFVTSGFSANLRGFVKPIGIELPAASSNPFDINGGLIDIIAAIAILLIALLLSRGTSEAARMEDILVISKVLAIILFVIVGLTVINVSNYVPFTPEHEITAAGDLGGWQGIYAGVSTIFLAYIGFDSIAANSTEVLDPQKTMPRDIFGSLSVAIVLFIAIVLVLVGMLYYSQYTNNAEPAGWVLHQSSHGVVAATVQTISVIGVLTASIGMMLAGSCLFYSSGRDGLLPSWLGHLNDKYLSNRALVIPTIIGVLIGSMFPFAFLAQLISAGTLVALMFVLLTTYRLRKREGKDLPIPAFKLPLYPVLSAATLVLVLLVFWGLEFEVKLYTLIRFIVSVILYLSYGPRHSKKNDAAEYHLPKQKIKKIVSHSTNIQMWK